MLNAQPRQRAADLCRLPAVDLAGLGGVKIMRAAIRYRGSSATHAGRKHPSAPGTSRPRLPPPQKRRINLSRRVVERDDQVQRGRAREPGVARPILVQHHPRQWTPLALATMRALARRTPARASVRRIRTLQKDQNYRTDQALPKPDISCATDRYLLHGFRGDRRGDIVAAAAKSGRLSLGRCFHGFYTSRYQTWLRENECCVRPP